MVYIFWLSMTISPDSIGRLSNTAELFFRPYLIIEIALVFPFLSVVPDITLLIFVFRILSCFDDFPLMSPDEARSPSLNDPGRHLDG